MISLVQKQDLILKHYREGLSQREIERITGIDRKTIRKYIKSYDKQREELLAEGAKETDILTSNIIEPPKYTVGVRPKRKLTSEIEQIIIGHVKENEKKRQKGQRKQVKTAKDIHESLQEEHNVDISYSTVLKVVRLFEQKPNEAYIKAYYLPGDVCEFDWAMVRITIARKLVTLQLAVFTSAKENYRWAHLFTSQKAECFQEAHVLFFENVGGVFLKVVYDNLTTAVRILAGTEKNPTKALLQLSLYYGFQFRFCNVRRGNEKGHVENSVEFVRRKAFAFKDTFDSLEEANEYLASICQKLNRRPQECNQNQTAEDLLHQARKELLPLPSAFDAARILHARVNKSSTIVVDQNYYSVPDHLVGKKIFVKVYSNRIRCFDQDKKIAEHIRLTGSREWSVQLNHYLNTLRKKPGAIASSLALQQNSCMKEIYEKYYTNKNKEFIELLQYIKDNNNETEVLKAIAKLVEMHPKHVTTAKIKFLCDKSDEGFTSPILTSQETKNIDSYAQEHLKEYDELFNLSNISEVSKV